MNSGFWSAAFHVLSVAFVMVVGIIVLVIIVIYIVDIVQTKHAIRRNYPVIGHFRYIFERLGGFFRQYFFAMDREELPFNRAMRTWVYRAAKNIDTTSAFGSTRDLRLPGTLLFVNTAFPTMDQDAVPVPECIIGSHCRHPYITKSIFNISPHLAIFRVI